MKKAGKENEPENLAHNRGTLVLVLHLLTLHLGLVAVEVEGKALVLVFPRREKSKTRTNRAISAVKGMLASITATPANIVQPKRL
jgi:hypothetical protein